MNRSLFGDKTHYYAADELPKRREDSLEERMIRQILQELEGDVEERVRLTYRKYNSIIREHLRADTALKLSRDGNRTSIPVEVLGGIPLSLNLIIRDISKEMLWLVTNRSLLENTQTGLAAVAGKVPDFSQALGLQNNSDKANLEQCSRLIEEFLEKIKSLKLPERILTIDEDVLGAYFFRKSTVQIYWMPIGIFAALTGISIELLTYVVLAHELAHAYTHLGTDIDGIKWDTDSFARTDKYIVEGLAQFYTALLCERQEFQMRGLSQAFNELLKMQSPCYTEFRNWEKTNAAEVVRYSMIMTRSNRIKNYQVFLEAMSDVRKQIRFNNRL